MIGPTPAGPKRQSVVTMGGDVTPTLGVELGAAEPGGTAPPAGVSCGAGTVTRTVWVMVRTAAGGRWGSGGGT